MCLKFNGNHEINKSLLGKPNSKGLYSGYKVFNKWWDGSCTSVYYGFKWRQGWNESSRVWSCITPNEKASERIDLGFHIFLNKKDALTVTIGNCGVICRKVYFKLEDVIATGTWDLGDERCVVVKKLFARFKSKELHEWEEVESQYSSEERVDVQCKKCGMRGEKTVKTGEVFYPAT